MTAIYCAIDTPDIDVAILTAKLVAQAGCGIKLGLEFFVNYGPEGIRRVRESCPQVPVFLDLKFHDIPNTVAGALRAAVRLGVAYTNVHAAGGREMMLLARQTIEDEANKLGVIPPKLLAVTVLTSMDNNGLAEIGVQSEAAQQVLRLARLTKECGLAGIVCSAHEIKLLRAELGNDFVLMVPGIRPAGVGHGDQKRVMSPPEAMEAGATHLVIGRPITEADDPQQAAKLILDSIAA